MKDDSKPINTESDEKSTRASLPKLVIRPDSVTIVLRSGLKAGKAPDLDPMDPGDGH